MRMMREDLSDGDEKRKTKLLRLLLLHYHRRFLSRTRSV
jgi:hypothetical protein